MPTVQLARHTPRDNLFFKFFKFFFSDHDATQIPIKRKILDTNKFWTEILIKKTYMRIEGDVECDEMMSL